MKMSCEKFRQLKDRYLQGVISGEEEQAIEKHLEGCHECQQLFDEWIKESEKRKILPNGFMNKVTTPYNSLDDKKQQRILRWAKYRNRLSMATSVLLLFLVASFIGSLLSSLYFTLGGEGSRMYRTQNTAVVLTELAFPNVTMPAVITAPSGGPHIFTSRGWGHSSIKIKPYFVALGEYALEKQIGKEKHSIGQLNINHLLMLTGTKWQWKDNGYQQFLYFYHPDQITEFIGNGIDERDLDNQETWQTLDAISEGTVAELAISFFETYSIDQVMNMLKDYDLDITWYAVSTGVEGKYVSDRDNSPLSAFNGVWGVPHMSSNMLNSYNPIRSDDSSAREGYFINSIEFLLKNERIAKKIYRGNSRELLLSERYEYVKENGVQVYGVVVTGPTKELLKLQELETIHSPALGEIQLWNWFHRSFEGTLY